MPRAAPIQTSFNTGEVSPLFYGRVDHAKYKSALAVCLNHIPFVQGPVTRRPGTVFVAQTKYANKATRLVRFNFSDTQQYVLEFGDLYVRIYRNHGRNESPPGTPIEIVTPYAAADIFALNFTQSADTLYIAHPKYHPATITRSSDTSWAYTDIFSQFVDGPYLNPNLTSTTLAFSAATGAGVTLTASSTTGINGGSGFQNTDVNRHVRFQTAAGAWGWARITAVTSTTVCTVTILSAVDINARTTWRLGMWSDTTGFPACVTFYQDRLGWAGASAMPQTLTFSVTSSYLTYQPTGYDNVATVTDSNALSFTLNSNDVQIIRWMIGDAQGLLVGTGSAEWLVTPSTLNEALTPINIKAVQMTSYGEATVQPVRVGYTTLGLQKAGRKVREFTFVYFENRYHAPDMTALAQHITAGGITQMAFQQEPNSILWCVRSDGTLIGFVYERDQEVTGWHRHAIGGFSDANGTPAKVVSVAVIQAPDNTRDEVWMIVQRYINGATVQYVEYMTKMWERGDDPTVAVYGDCSLQYNGAPTSTVTGMTQCVGEKVGVLADGSSHPDVIVANDGSVSLNRTASKITIGYRYNSDGQALRNDAGGGNGTAQGKLQRTHKVIVRVHDALALSVGRSFDNLDLLPVRDGADALGSALALQSGDVPTTWEGDYTRDNYVCWRFSDMLPGTVVAIMPQLETQDG